MTTLLKTSEIGSLYWRFLLLFPAWQRQRPTRRRNRLLLYTGVRPAPSPAHDGMQRGPGLGVGPTVRQAIIRVGSSQIFGCWRYSMPRGIVTQGRICSASHLFILELLLWGYLHIDGLGRGY